MNLSRRECLVLLGGGAAVAGCAPLAHQISQSPEAVPLPSGEIEPSVRLLNRLTFGPKPGDISGMKALGRDEAVERLLRAEEPEEARLQLMLYRLDVLRAEPSDLHDLPEAEVMRQLQQAGILRAVYGRNQLLERMVDFWSNHFNIYVPKEDGTFWKGKNESEVVRKHGLGKFGDLLSASAHSPAMLAYLDNSKNERKGPNENYARELLELHTLGVDGGYTQRDVREVARCFTGWTIETRFLRPRGRFRFDEDRHDQSEKVVLGHRIPAGGGITDGERILEILASHPGTARHLTAKLSNYFLGTVDPTVQSIAEKAFLTSGGDIRETLRPILGSQALLEAPPIIKRPFDYLVSAIRATNGQTDGGKALQDHLEKMGEPLYLWPMPDGYPTRTSAWTGSMLPRWNFAFAYANGNVAGSKPGEFGNPIEATLCRKPEGGEPADLALCLASPEFQWR